MLKKRITIFAGHYGSGKTTIALNYAFFLKSACQNVAICDIDIVNPYFRTLDAKDLIVKNGIKLISSKYANTNVEFPSIPPHAQSIFDDKNIFAVVDLGGDDRGALALGRYSGFINNKNECDMLLVINKYRPFTSDIDGLICIKEEIENAANVKFTGIVNNSNLGLETDITKIYEAIPFAEEVSSVLDLPIMMTSVRRDLLDLTVSISNAFPIDIFYKAL